METYMEDKFLKTLYLIGCGLPVSFLASFIHYTTYQYTGYFIGVCYLIGISFFYSIYIYDKKFFLIANTLSFSLALGLTFLFMHDSSWFFPFSVYGVAAVLFALSLALQLTVQYLYENIEIDFERFQ